jgi:hypothetical protein
VSRGARPTGRAQILLTFAGLAVVSTLLGGAFLALVAIGSSGWRLVPAAWPAWTNALALAAVVSSGVLLGALAALLAALLRDVLAPGHLGGPGRNSPQEEPFSSLPARFAYMGGAEFENEMALLLRACGYSVHRAPKSGGALGVDLLLRKGNNTIAVQLKRWSAPVGDRSVQALFGGRVHHGADEAWLITTSRFTPKALELARTAGVRLVDGAELSIWLTEDLPPNLKD